MTSTTDISQETLFQRAGGDAAFQAVMSRFFERIVADPELAPIFSRTNIERHARRTASFVAAATGGPKPWRGPDMAAAHAHLHATDAQFDRVAGHLVDTLEELAVPAAVADELLDIVGSLRSQIVTG